MSVEKCDHILTHRQTRAYLYGPAMEGMHRFVEFSSESGNRGQRVNLAEELGSRSGAGTVLRKADPVSHVERNQAPIITT